MSVPVDQKEAPHFGNDGLASPSLMSDYVKDLSEVSASSCELGQLLPDKEILDEDIQGKIQKHGTITRNTGPPFAFGPCT